MTGTTRGGRIPGSSNTPDEYRPLVRNSSMYIMHFIESEGLEKMLRSRASDAIGDRIAEQEMAIPINRAIMEFRDEFSSLVRNNNVILSAADIKHISGALENVVTGYNCSMDDNHHFSVNGERMLNVIGYIHQLSIMENLKEIMK